MDFCQQGTCTLLRHVVIVPPHAKLLAAANRLDFGWPDGTSRMSLDYIIFLHIGTMFACFPPTESSVPVSDRIERTGFKAAGFFDSLHPSFSLFFHLRRKHECNTSAIGIH